MKKIVHFFRIHTPPEQVYAVLTTEAGLSGWWTLSVVIEPAEPAVVHFRFAGDLPSDWLSRPRFLCAVAG